MHTVVEQPTLYTLGQKNFKRPPILLDKIPFSSSVEGRKGQLFLLLWNVSKYVCIVQGGGNFQKIQLTSSEIIHCLKYLNRKVIHIFTFLF